MKKHPPTKRKSMANVTEETVYRIYNDETGDYYEVCEDADILDLCEIRSCVKSGEIKKRIVVEPQMVLPLSNALRRWREDRNNDNKDTSK